MGERITKSKQSSKQEEETIDESPEPVTVMNVDDLLEEIDGVLEENAEEFVSQYVQKGGE